MANPIFKKLFIFTNLGGKPIELDNVFSMVHGTRTKRTGTFRNEGWDAGKMDVYNSGTSPTVAVATAVPVTGKGGTTPLAADLTTLQFAVPDAMAGIPPRPYSSLESGYLFGMKDGEAIPGPAAIPFASIPFTVNATTNVCTAGSAHGRNTGDTVAVSAATTLAAPLSATAVYTFLKVSATDFMLMTAAGAPVDFSTAGTGQQTAVLVNSIAPPDDVAGSVFFVPDAWDPQISTSDPRL